MSNSAPSQKTGPCRADAHTFDLIPAHTRGRTQTAWLSSAHSFSFGAYHDPARMECGHLRVINDDVIAPGSGFGMHGHRDMEIVTLVLSGSLAHRDSLGYGTIITPHDVQRMRAGTGIEHSEYNASTDDILHLLQIWVRPSQKNLPPSYVQKEMPASLVRNRFGLVIAPEAQADSGLISWHQDVWLYRGQYETGQIATFTAQKGRQLYIFMAQGQAALSGEEKTFSLHAGDALALRVSPLAPVAIKHQFLSNADLLIFEQ